MTDIWLAARESFYSVVARMRSPIRKKEMVEWQNICNKL